MGRVIALPTRVLRTAEGALTLLLPPAHPSAHCLVPAAAGWRLPHPLIGAGS